MYDALCDFRDAVKDLDDQLQAAHGAIDSLSALSSPESAMTAVERARNCLFDSVTSSSDTEINTNWNPVLQEEEDDDDDDDSSSLGKLNTAADIYRPPTDNDMAARAIHI